MKNHTNYKNVLEDARAEFSHKTDTIYWIGFAMIAISNAFMMNEVGLFIVLPLLLVGFMYGSTYLMEQSLDKPYLYWLSLTARMLFGVAILTGFISEQPAMYSVTTFVVALTFYYIAVQKLREEIFKFMI